MKSSRFVAIAAAGVFALASAPALAVSLFSFEGLQFGTEPSIPGAINSGSALVDDGSLGGVGPTWGSRQLVIESASFPTPPLWQNLVGPFYGVPDDPARSFGTWAYEVDAIAGTTYEFYYNFLTSNLATRSALDWFGIGLVEMTGPSTGNWLGTLAFESNRTPNLLGGGPLLGQTGDRLVSWTAPSTARYQFEFVVTSSTSTVDQQGFVTPGIPTYVILQGRVPEPATLALLALALGGVGVAARRRRVAA